ncbi:hypothetical protein HYU17_02200 [Candidatus Woesearchaeota archaeon]|nr:hypothetical protein [Candidatus Woesearchaeota archaeon]
MGTFDVLKPLKPLIRPFELVGKKVAIAVNYVLLTLVYFTAFAATKAVAKIAGKRFLELKPDHARKSYWVERQKEDPSKAEAYRQF